METDEILKEIRGEEERAKIEIEKAELRAKKILADTNDRVKEELRKATVAGAKLREKIIKSREKEADAEIKKLSSKYDAELEEIKEIDIDKFVPEIVDLLLKEA